MNHTKKMIMTVRRLRVGSSMRDMKELQKLLSMYQHRSLLNMMLPFLAKDLQPLQLWRLVVTHVEELVTSVMMARAAHPFGSIVGSLNCSVTPVRPVMAVIITSASSSNALSVMSLNMRVCEGGKGGQTRQRWQTKDLN